MRGEGSGDKLEFQVMDAGNKLFHVSSSTPDILDVLSQMEKVLCKVQQQSKSMIIALHPIIQALIAERLLKHHNVNVNISVVCCICEILRIMVPDSPYNNQQMKEFFEVVVTSFEKQSSASGGYYGKLTRVIEIFSKSRLPLMMLDIHVEELVGRLFKQFLTFADSNDSYTVLKMEKIMTLIIEESQEAVNLEALVITTLEKVNKIASPICWQLGEKVIINCAAKLRPHLPVLAQDEAKETIPCTSDTTHRIKSEPIEESVNMEQTLSDCQDSTKDRVIHSDDEKNAVSFNDPSVTSNCVTEVNGKRKRDNEQRTPKKVVYSMTRVQGYKVKKSNAPILEAIFKKHGDIASNCVVKTASVRESILEVICDVVKRIQTNDFATIICDMEEIEMQVLDAEATNMNVAWLRTHLEAFHKKNAAQKRSTLLAKMKTNTSLIKRAAKMDLEERRIELATAQEQFKKAERCVEVLDIVETKLNDKFLESEAEKDSWLKDSVL